MPKEPTEKGDDPGLELPDDAWLTWNEETGAWDKQDAPRGGLKSTSPRATPAASSAPRKTAAAKTSETPEPKPPPGPAATGSSAGWRPQAEHGAPVVPVERSTQIRSARSSAVPPRAQPMSSEGDGWPVAAIAAGAATGAAAGYLLTFLVA